MKRYFLYRNINPNRYKEEPKKPKTGYQIDITIVYIFAAIIFTAYLFTANLISQANLTILIFLLLLAILTMFIDIGKLITKIGKYGNKNRALFFVIGIVIIILLYGYLNPTPKPDWNNFPNEFKPQSNAIDCTNMNNPGCEEIRKELTRDSHGIAPIQKKYLDFATINDFYNSLEGLTTLQRTNTYNSYVGKYVKWTMKVVVLEIQSDKSWLNRAVDLYDVDRNTLLSLKLNQMVTFEGMILPETDSSGKTIPYSLGIYDLNLRNGEIIK